MPQAAAATPARHWYGWQTLSADGISLALFVAGATSDGSGELMAVAGLSYLFVPPIIHAGHARVGMSFASFGVRVGLPMGGLFAGVASKDLGTAVVGLSLGVLGAVAMDSALFAWDAPEPEREATVARIAPTVAPVPGGASAGVIGVF